MLCGARRHRHSPFMDSENQTELLPERLSPSRAKDYLQCPKLFYYKTIRKLRDPATIHTARGSLAHETLDRVFDQPKGQRGPETAVNLIGPAWQEMRDGRDYQQLLEDNPGIEQELLEQAEKSVRGWYKMEDPDRFDPAGRELRLEAELGGAPVVGIIDRYDSIEKSDGTTYRAISDYKTGKLPKPRYVDEAFYAMNIYAALMHATKNVVVEELRLVYVTTADRDGVLRRQVTLPDIKKTAQKIGSVWRSIKRDAAQGRWATRTGPLCQWCSYIDICPAFNNDIDGLDIEAGNTEHETVNAGAAAAVIGLRVGACSGAGHAA